MAESVYLVVDPGGDDDPATVYAVCENQEEADAYIRNLPRFTAQIAQVARLPVGWRTDDTRFGTYFYNFAVERIHD